MIENGIHGKLADLSQLETFVAALRELIACGPSERARLGEAAADRMALEFSRPQRLPNVLCALDLPKQAAPEFRLKNLYFKATPT
jgi:hypothetical protein